MSTPSHETRLRGALKAVAADRGPDGAVSASLDALAAMDGLSGDAVALMAIRWAGGIMGPKEAGPVLGCDPSNIGQVRAVYGGPTVIGKASGHSLYIGSDVHRIAEKRRNGEGRSRRGRRAAIAPARWTPPEERAVS